MKKRFSKVFMVLMLVGLLIPVIPALAASEVIYQTSFENDDLGAWGSFGPSSVTITTEAAQDGKSSVKVADRVDGWNGMAINATQIFQKGGTYEGTAYVKAAKAPSGTQVINMTIAQDKGGSAEYKNLGSVEIKDDKWVKINFEYDAAGDYDLLNLYFEYDVPTGSFFVDNITIAMTKAPAGGYKYPPNHVPQPPVVEEPVVEEPVVEEPVVEEPVVEEPVVVVPEGPNNISRGDFLVVLVNTLGLNAEFKSNFADVKEGTFYYNAVGVAKAIGLVEGIGDNKYNPDGNFSTQDIMVLTVRALEKFYGLEKTSDTAVLDQFTDKDRISSYAVDSVATLAKEGYLADIGEKLDPRGNSNWGVAVNLLSQISKKLAE